jgi:hypothetical protein
LLGIAACAFLSSPQARAGAAAPVHSDEPDFLNEMASGDTRKVAAWVMATADNRDSPFIIIDKVHAKVFVFDRGGVLLGAAPALLGLAKGDKSPDGIGKRKLATISPAERITPAGRFVAAIGENLGGKDILWIDYEAAVSLHRVADAKPSERRLQRLATPAVSDNRISYGCINVPAKFYEAVVSPLFRATAGIVYILPEKQSVDEVFFPRPEAAAVGTGANVPFGTPSFSAR